MDSVLTLIAVDHEIEPWSGQTMGFKISICCLSTRSGWLGIRIMCLNGVTCLLAIVVLQSWHHHHFIECSMFSSWYSCKIARVTLNNNNLLNSLLMIENNIQRYVYLIVYYWIHFECPLKSIFIFVGGFLFANFLTLNTNHAKLFLKINNFFQTSQMDCQHTKFLW